MADANGVGSADSGTLPHTESVPSSLGSCEAVGHPSFWGLVGELTLRPRLPGAQARDTGSTGSMEGAREAVLLATHRANEKTDRAAVQHVPCACLRRSWARHPQPVG